MSTAVFSPGHVVAGRYRIEQLLGQGGMGSVYRALQLSVGRPVALKLLGGEHTGSADLLERFQREAVALARLAHPNTVRLFDFGTSEGGPFLVMEFLRGTDLSRDLEHGGPLRYDHALRVTRQILCSLSEAHDAGIVHRDVKPANVFLCAGSSWPLVKVLDFGIVGDIVADPVAPRLTRTGTVLGSVAYMSPEQAQGLAVGPAADLYAVGVVLFEMLTGRTLFDPLVCTAQLIAKVTEPAPRLRDAGPELRVPAELEALVADLVERDARRRPGSARAVIERVDALLARADLPPLVRAVADSSSSVARSRGSTLRGVASGTVGSPLEALAGGGRAIPPTEPMLLPHAAGDSWAPHPVIDVPPRPPTSRRRGRSLAVAFTLLGFAGGAVGVFLGPLRATPAGQTLAAAAAALIQMPLPGEQRTEPAQLASAAVVAPPPSSAEAPAGGVAGEAASGISASAAGPALLEVAALAPALPAAPVLEVPAAPPPRASIPAEAAKPTRAKPVPAKPAPRRQPRPVPTSPEPAPIAASPEPAPIAASPAEPAPVTASPEPAPVATSPAEPAPVAASPAEPAPVAASPEPAPTPSASASPGPSRPDTLILPETLGAAAGASATPASAGSSGTASGPSAPPEPERPAPPPITLSPSGEPGTVEAAPPPAWGDRREPRHARRPSSLSAVEAAYHAGEISRQERDELVAVLRQLQAEALARADRAYREGRISRRELWLRQRQIDREFEGEPAYRDPTPRERTRSRIRLRW